MSVRVQSCSFFRLGCRGGHQLFASSYARSNKKRSAKLLRCFPHCCPDHVPRSYCGCSVHLLVTFESADDAIAADRNEDVVVCARFEAASLAPVTGLGDAVTAMPTDAIVALPASALQESGTAAESDWVRAERVSDVYQRQFPENTIAYVLNNHRSPRWYYGFESGSTKAQREMKHVLAAYVFELHPLPERHRKSQANGDRATSSPPLPVARLATVVARQASPPFTMISYRRQSDARRLERATATTKVTGRAATRDVVAPVPTTEQASAPSAVATKTATARMNLTPGNESAENADELIEDDENGVEAAHLEAPAMRRDMESHDLWRQTQPIQDYSMQPTSQQIAPHSRQIPVVQPLQQPARLPAHSCPVCSGTLTSHLPSRDTMERLQHLLLLQLFLQFVPLESYSFYFGSLDFRIQRRWIAKISPVKETPENGDAGSDMSARALVADVASAFSLSCFSTAGQMHQRVSATDSTMAPVTNHVREQSVLQKCADLLLDVFSSQRVQQIVSSIATGAVGNRFQHQTESCELFGQLVADLFDELTLLLSIRSSNNAQFGQVAQLGQFRYSNHSGQLDDHASVATLVDDILSLVYAEPKYRWLRTAVSALLLRKRDTLDVAAQRLFRVFVSQRRGEAETELGGPPTNQRPGRSAVDPSVAGAAGTRLQGFDRCSVWNRRWFLVAPSISVVPLQTEIGQGDRSEHGTGSDDRPVETSSLSLLDVVAFIRMFASVDLDVQGWRLCVSSAMDTSPTRRSRALVLDGQVHTFDSFPNSLTAEAMGAIFGSCWSASVYKGYVADSGRSFDLLLFPLPESATLSQRSEVARRIRVRCAAGEAVQTEGLNLSVFAEISCAQIPLPPVGRGTTTTRMPEDLALVSWRPMLELSAEFAGVSANI